MATAMIAVAAAVFGTPHFTNVSIKLPHKDQRQQQR